MDSNPIEKERGITIKLAPVRMEYTDPRDDQKYILNLIDTPGHVDFGYEVSRSLAACEGVLLVVDATQGIQAQTLANYEKAHQLGLKVIPVVNKIDLPSSDVEGAVLEIMDAFGVEEDEIACVSAKTGLNIDILLQKIVDKVPAPTGDAAAPLRALVFTSQFDIHRGVVAYVRVVDGVLKKNDKLQLMSTGAGFFPQEVGVFIPQQHAVEQLGPGEVGYIFTGLKEVAQLRVGDTVTLASAVDRVEQLPGYLEPTPMVYMQFYPIDGEDFVLLQDAIGKLSLHDSSLVSTGVHSLALGNGLRIGFLGLLHAEIVRERLEREFDLNLVVTTPTVTYQVETTAGEKIWIHSPDELPDLSQVKTIFEPMTTSLIYTPEEYMSEVIKLCRAHRGELLDVEHKGIRARLKYRMPLAELIVNFHDQLKSASSGFASLEYELDSFEPVDAVKLDIMIHGEPIEALSLIVVRDQAEIIGRSLAKKLKEVVPRQMFEIPIQATIGARIIARETVKAFRKDVTAKLYGGDVTRRQKLLKKQAKGKKKMKQIGRVELNQETFLAVLEP
jgi:GTP-binding protein LepA